MSAPLRVFFVPLGPARHVPYSETADGDDATPAHDGRGFVGRLVQRFRHVLSAAEKSRLRHGEHRAGPQGLLGRIKAWGLRWIADRIAEQRLLWQLRTRPEATLVYPSDLAETEAMRLLRAALKHDGDRHRRWLIVNAALLVVSGVLAIVPGPNLIAYYFAFRVVGHFLSIRGAKHGLDHCSWSAEPSAALTDLRAALALDRETRRTRVHDIAAHLELPHLATFVERVAVRGA